MDIMAIQSLQTARDARRVVRERKANDPDDQRIPPSPLVDTYEPSKSSIRQDLIASIKEKIKAGYYNSREVVDDLTDSFAKAFNTIE
jgi:anti-sigma28 factor (negative regulator of flagellin synthesis)